jgi:hypothetical protein
VQTVPSGRILTAQKRARPKKLSCKICRHRFRGVTGRTTFAVHARRADTAGRARAPGCGVPLSASTQAGCSVLCRWLCRNPAIPAGIPLGQWVSLGNGSEIVSMQRTRMNTGVSHHSGSLSIVPLHIGQGIDTVEVRGSSPLVPTISSLDSALSSERYPERYRNSSPVAQQSAPQNAHKKPDTSWLPVPRQNPALYIRPCGRLWSSVVRWRCYDRNRSTQKKNERGSLASCPH